MNVPSKIVKNSIDISRNMSRVNHPYKINKMLNIFKKNFGRS